MKIAFISDIHEDVLSLKRAISLIEKAGCDEIICLGDISGFSVPYYNYYSSRNASECLSIVIKNCSSLVLGNHDLYAINKTPDISLNFKYPENWYELDYQQKLALSKDQLWLSEVNELNPLYKNADLEILSSYPEFEILKRENINIFISHYLYPNITGCEKQFYLNYNQFFDHLKFIEEKNCSISFSGHFHSEGIAYASDNKFVLKGFKKIKIPSGLTSFLCPAIAKGRNRNGFLIFDKEENTIAAKKI